MIAVETMTFAAALDAWINKKRRTWCPKVTDHVRRLAKGWVEVVGEATSVGAVTVADVEKIETIRDDGRRSGSALNQERTYLRQFFKWCRLNEWRTSDPTLTWTYRSTEVKREYYALSREEEERLIEVSPPWLRKFIRVAVCTGQREGTIKGLTWGMLDADGVLSIPSSLIKKTRRALRVPLVEKARAELGERQPNECPLIPGIPAPTIVYREFKKYAAKAGLPEIVSPHDLKRTCIARLTGAGVSLDRVMALLGYRTMGIILKHYFAPVPTEEARGILERI